MKNKKRSFPFIIACLLILLPLLIFFLRDHPAGKSADRTKVITESTIDSLNGMDYELWKDSGETKMTVSGSGAYICEWKDTHNVIFRTGRKFKETRPVSSFGRIDLQYAADYRPEGNSFLGVYGWTKDPLVEYYIVENWGDFRPDDRQSETGERTYLGTCTVNGTEYDIYSSLQENQPSIEGLETTFPQYWSVRRTPSTKGTVCVSDHFRIWESKGLSLGDIFEISFAVEGMESSGYAEVSRSQLTWEK